MPAPCEAASRVEVYLPHLLTDITTIVDGQSQADPQFRTNRLYTRLTATEVRRQLIAQKGYRVLPPPATIWQEHSRQIRRFQWFTKNQDEQTPTPLLTPGQFFYCNGYFQYVSPIPII